MNGNTVMVIALGMFFAMMATAFISGAAVDIAEHNNSCIEERVNDE